MGRVHGVLLFALALSWEFFAAEASVVQCSGNACYTNCEAAIPQIQSNSCTNRALAADFCACAQRSWNCTNICGCFRKAGCESQQNSFGVGCNLNCASFTETVKADRSLFEGSVGEWDETEWLFIVLSSLAALCCLLLLLSIPCCFAFTKFLEKGSRRTYTDDDYPDYRGIEVGEEVAGPVPQETA